MVGDADRVGPSVVVAGAFGAAAGTVVLALADNGNNKVAAAITRRLRTMPENLRANEELPRMRSIINEGLCSRTKLEPNAVRTAGIWLVASMH